MRLLVHYLSWIQNHACTELDNMVNNHLLVIQVETHHKHSGCCAVSTTNNLFTAKTCVKETQSNQACVRISFQKFDSINWISILRACHIRSERFLICSTNGQISCSFYCNKHKHSRNLPYESLASSEKRVCFCSLFCSVEKPSYAHSDQLLHCEPVLC